MVEGSLQSAGLSPADCTGQNAETRSNGATLRRPMMLFLSPALDMPGAAGFSAQSRPLLYDRHSNGTGQLKRQCWGQKQNKTENLFQPWDFIHLFSQNVSFFMNETLLHSSNQQPVRFFYIQCAFIFCTRYGVFLGCWWRDDMNSGIVFISHSHFICRCIL